MAKSSFKSITDFLHLWLGLASGIVVIVVSITGCIFVFEEEIRNITQKGYRFVQPESRAKITTADAISILNKQFPGKQIEQLRLFSQPDRAMIARLTDIEKVNSKRPERRRKRRQRKMKKVQKQG